jgi:hypothetical protein
MEETPMSKFLKVLIVMLTIAAFAAPVMAADNFSVSGNMLVYGTYTDADAANGATNTWGYQKLRVYGIFKANDMVNVQFRSDFVEGNWGADAGHGRLSQIGNQMDRAFLEVNLDAVKLRAGTQYVAFGKSGSFIFQDTAITAYTKGDMPITVTYSHLDDASRTATSLNRDIFGANIKLNAFNVFGGIDADNDKSVYMLGATYQAKYDNINVVAEADFFAGEMSSTVDAQGLTGFVDASMAVSDTLTAGGAVYYAGGNNDANKTQVTKLGNSFGTWDPLTRGPFADENYLVVSRPYELLGEAGLIAIQAYADVKISDKLSAGGSLAYGMPAEDNATTTDSFIFTSVHATYALAANCDFYNGVQLVSVDDTVATSGETLLSFMTGLNVSF